jgi:hypothetical protein
VQTTYPISPHNGHEFSAGDLIYDVTGVLRAAPQGNREAAVRKPGQAVATHLVRAIAVTPSPAAAPPTHPANTSPRNRPTASTVSPRPQKTRPKRTRPAHGLLPSAALPLAPEDIARQILDLANWTDFKGYGVLPGIRAAAFEVRTPVVVGTRIRVTNTDGSGHVEEIAEWEPARRLRLDMKEFSPPLSRLATGFEEA